MDDRVTAHRVADERDLLHAHFVDNGDDIVTERGEVPVGAAEPRLAVTSQVDRNDLIPLGKVVDLVRPVGPIASPAVHENDRRSFGAIRCVRDLDAVTARGHGDAPGRIRTSDPLLRRQPLCPLSYGGRWSG